MAQNIVNLRLFRKRRTRQEADEAAQANRISHGASKMERETATARQKLDAARLDGHFRGDQPDLPQASKPPGKP